MQSYGWIVNLKYRYHVRTQSISRDRGAEKLHIRQNGGVWLEAPDGSLSRASAENFQEGGPTEKKDRKIAKKHLKMAF